MLDNRTPWPAQFIMAFDRKGHEQMVAVVKVTFVLPAEPGAPCALAEEQLPLTETDVFGADPALDAPIFETDFAARKPFCDVLCHGHAFAPEGRPVTELGVGIRLGQWSKRFTVHGARIWLRRAAGFRPSDRRPFDRQPIGYDAAFGGTDSDPSDPGRVQGYDDNPCGTGFYPLQQDLEGKPLPLTAAWGEEAATPLGPCRPMAFGPIGRAWAPRRPFAGTYDDRWTAERMPFLPDDFDDRYFQAAALDQQVTYPQGDEPVELVNLSPRGRIATRLPRLQVVAGYERRSGRITPRIADLDTVLFLPEQDRMTLTYRARLTAERDLFEFTRLAITATGPEGQRHG